MSMLADRSGEFAMTDRDFATIAGLLRDETGIDLPHWKATLVYSRLAKRLRALGLANFGEYCDLVCDDAGANERRAMCAALTTNVTRFFREPHHFGHLRAHALPPLVEAARKGKRIRLWSAACSSGEEPYSMALTILSLMPDAASHDIRVLATDINPAMLAHGRRGVFERAALADVPADLRSRWFAPAPGHGDAVQAAVELRSLIAFRELNLVGPWPMRAAYQAVLCRNVAIYFSQATQGELWGRIGKVLPTGGWLYIGHSERIGRPAADLYESSGITTYRRREGGTA